jgi:SAM-dependent methyltransferase
MIASAVPSRTARDEYAASLESGAAHKAAQIRPWLRAGRGDVVLDVGTAAGGVAAALARTLPEVTVLGTDISRTAVASARARHAADPVAFAHGAASERLVDGAAAVVMGAVLHEVFSGSGDLLGPVRHALVAAYRALAPGGRLVIRDFVRPANAAQQVVLEHRTSDMQPGRTFDDFAASSPRPIALRSVRERPGRTLYETTLGACYEYLFRKDAGVVWEHELEERYGFWTADDAVRLVGAAGFDVLAALDIPHRWVIEHRLRGRVRVLDAGTGTPLRVPARQLFLVAQRPR